ncbi:hypothetical protein GDO78_009763 [Eleutherodactylus coqui]|uniref:Uncharacterized protein n=1 Tax=Eleutherodactylus coqui TaxID=57060 RepID=A0A8J6K9F4_ELECQ|nr:hypothetical protein GDO78_009763 [Eleutherodactylus coqui]
MSDSFTVAFGTATTFFFRCLTGERFLDSCKLSIVGQPLLCVPLLRLPSSESNPCPFPLSLVLLLQSVLELCFSTFKDLVEAVCKVEHRKGYKLEMVIKCL